MNKLRRKAQVSMEFLVLIGFVFLMSFGLIFAAGTQLGNFRDDRNKELVTDFGSWIKSELDVASVVHNGYIRQITLPNKIDDTIEYTIITNGSAIVIEAEDQTYIGLIPIIQGSIQKGKNTIYRDNQIITIENG